MASDGIVFDNTFTANCTQNYIDCVLAAEQDIAKLWDNSITLRLKFDQENAGDTGFLARNKFGTLDVSYSDLVKALPSSDMLPAADPSPADHQWHIPKAYARMLGLTQEKPSVDDTITLNTWYKWDFKQDVISTVEHELSEGSMGRIGGLGDQNDSWSTMDLFRFNSADVRDLTDGRDGQLTRFSVDGFRLSPLVFNNEYDSEGKNVNTGDTADFKQLDVFGTGRVGDTSTYSKTDLDVMAALGWRHTVGLVPTELKVGGFSVASGQTLSLAPHVEIFNPSEDEISTYWVKDVGGGHGQLLVGGLVVTGDQWVQASKDWANVQYVGGAAGTDNLQIKIYDSTTASSIQSAEFSVTSAPVTPNTDAAAELFQFMAGKVPDRASLDGVASLMTGLAASSNPAAAWEAIGASLADSSFAPRFAATYEGLDTQSFISKVSQDAFGPQINSADFAQTYAGLLSYYAAIPDSNDPTGQVRADGAFIAEMLREAADFKTGVYYEVGQAFVTQVAAGTAHYDVSLFG